MDKYYKKARLANIIMAIFLILTGCAQSKDDQNKNPQTETRSEGDMVILDNGIVEIGFSQINGSITKLTDVKRNISFVDDTAAKPFRIDRGGRLNDSFASFSYEKDKEYENGQAYILMWEIEEGIRLKGRIELADGSDQVSFTSELENSTSSGINAVEYPIIGRINSIGQNDYLAHPYVTGLLIENPLKNFIGDMGGLRYMPYPESFSGASMQFFTYYAEGVGGLYCAAYDGDFHQKWLNFYKNGGKLELSLMYGYEDIGPNKGMKAEFPFIVKMINGDSWYEAADIYKEWAVKQKWTQKGRLIDRADNNKAVWLLEEVGLSTFGIDAGYDRTKWIRLYHDTVKTPVFHILGPDWVNDVQTFDRGVPGGYEDWIPTKFNKENLELIKAQGDYFAPFEFDFLVDPNKSDGANLRKNLILWPDDPKSHDKYTFNMLCPFTDYTKNLHVNRDVQVYKEASVDSMYYDISANNLIKTCMSSTHGHPIGAGRIITESYREIYQKTKEALNETAGKYIPLGTEMINETLIDVLDYYQARAWAQPSSALETWPFRNLMKSGKAQMIPMFTYVYHEYAPVRLDGWGKLVEEIGDLFYHTVAKTYLWGGLYELNYEYSPMEAIDGVETPPEEHYWKFRPRGYEFSPERAQYITQFAALRTGAGNRYLAYGTMRRPVDIDAPKKKLSWYHYNHSSNNEKGQYEVDSVFTSTWEFADQNERSLAVMLANVTDETVEAGFELDLKAYGFEGDWNIRLLSGFDSEGNYRIENLGLMKDMKTLTLMLDAHTVYMLEAYKIEN